MNRQEGTYRIIESAEHLYPPAASAYNYQILDIENGIAFVSPIDTVKTGKVSSTKVIARMSCCIDEDNLIRVR